MIYQRYADPFKLLNQMILSGRFQEFIEKLDDIQAKEKEDETMWEFYLHKVFNQTYSEFLNGTKKPQVNPDVNLGATIKDSYSILQGFVPDDMPQLH